MISISTNKLKYQIHIISRKILKNLIVTQNCPVLTWLEKYINFTLIFNNVNIALLYRTK